MSGPMFTGSIPALITPFANGAVDETAFQDFVQWQIDEGSHAVVPCGTTGESPTLSHEEDKRVVQLCVEVAKGKVPVIAGTGSNSTAEAIDLTRHAKDAGADAVLVVTPYYNKPSQDGLYAHYKAIQDAVEIPIILYNVPARTSVRAEPETVARLAELPNLVGIKDATADLVYMADLRRLIGDDFTYLSGEDPTAVPYLSLGGHGCISVTANAAPRLCARLQEAWQAGDVATVRELDDRLMPLHRALFCETSPAPIKYAASLLGHGDGRVRLPLVSASKNARAKVRDAMVHAGLLN